MVLDDCPGAADLKRPTIKYKTCPKCGEEIELFSDDVKMDCDGCGLTVYNDALSCVEWCEYAKECVGEETYETLMKIIKQKQTQS
jgi:hypothetical protein